MFLLQQQRNNQKNSGREKHKSEFLTKK